MDAGQAGPEVSMVPFEHLCGGAVWGEVWAWGGNPAGSQWSDATPEGEAHHPSFLGEGGVGGCGLN